MQRDYSEQLDSLEIPVHLVLLVILDSRVLRVILGPWGPEGLLAFEAIPESEAKTGQRDRWDHGVQMELLDPLDLLGQSGLLDRKAIPDPEVSRDSVENWGWVVIPGLMDQLDQRGLRETKARLDQLEYPVLLGRLAHPDHKENLGCLEQRVLRDYVVNLEQLA